MYSFIDFTAGTNFYLNLYCFLLYCVLVFVSLRGNVTDLNSQESSKGRTLLLAGGLLLFALTSFVGADFFFYHETMSTFSNQAYVDPEAGLEAFYQRLIYYTNGNYLLFRLIVWGSCLALIISAARKFGANIYHTLFIILAGFIITYSYARASLAVSVFFMGVVIICMAINNKLKVLPVIIGAGIIASTTFFHRSMLPMTVVATLWLFLPWKKMLSKYSLWLFPLFVAVFYVVLKVAFGDLFALANVIDDETGILDKAEFYSEQDVAEANANGYIRLAIHYMVFYLPMLVLSNTFRSEHVLQLVEKKCIWLYQITYLIFAFATAFALLDFDSNVLFKRYLYMSFIPLAILIAYLKDSEALPIKRYYWIVICFILCNLFQLFAFVYSVR